MQAAVNEHLASRRPELSLKRKLEQLALLAPAPKEQLALPAPPPKVASLAAGAAKTDKDPLLADTLAMVTVPVIMKKLSSADVGALLAQ